MSTPDPGTPPDLLTYTQAAALMGCSPRTLHRLIDRGDVVPVRPIVGGPRIRRSDLVALDGAA